MSYKFCFVILNYNTVDESLECIDSIKKLKDFSDSFIIVVDNGSQEDVTRIKTQFPEVIIIKSEYNVGFSKGNNIGYQYAKHVINPDFIIIVNSDTIFEQKDFLIQLSYLYDDNEFFVFGPDIITKYGEHQNPAYHVMTTSKSVAKGIAIQRIRLLLTYVPFASRAIRKQKKDNKRDRIVNDQMNVPLHGSCIVFSPLFIRKHEHAFFPDVFMYGEEEFLFFNCMMNNEKMLYSNKAFIRHLEDSSTTKSIKNQLERKRFILRNSIKSLETLKRYLKTKGEWKRWK